jgi:hypothetical protein
MNATVLPCYWHIITCRFDSNSESVLNDRHLKAFWEMFYANQHIQRHSYCQLPC